MNDILRGSWDPNSGLSAQQGDDSKVWAEFRMHAVIDGPATKEAGRTIKRDVPYIKIIQPGESRLSIYDQPATDEDTARFPRQWAAFKAGQSQETKGTPLDLLFPESPAIVENLKAVSIRTVEQLAALPDTGLQNIGMGARQWKEKATAYLAAAEQGKGFHGLSDRVDKLDRQITEKDNRIAALEAALAEATERKKGRNAA